MKNDKQSKQIGLHANIELNYQYEGRSAFKMQVNVQVEPAGITAIFGHSGSGKTTLLRCIGGLQKPDKGIISVQGRVWQSSTTWVPTHKRHIGYVFQEPSLLPHLSVEKNIQFAKRRALRNISSEQYAELLSIMDVELLLNKMPSTLSGGEKQRVAIVRALVCSPTLLLFDEPLASLDNDRKNEILPYFEKIKTQLAIPILYVTHSIEEVMRLADKVIVLKSGNIISSGESVDVFNHLNLDNNNSTILAGTVIELESEWQLMKVNVGSSILSLPLCRSINEIVRIRVFASDVSIALTDHSESSILNRVEAEIIDIKDEESSTAIITLTLGEQKLFARVTKKSVHALNLYINKKVFAQVKSAAIVS